MKSPRPEPRAIRLVFLASGESFEVSKKRITATRKISIAHSYGIGYKYRSEKVSKPNANLYPVPFMVIPLGDAARS